MKFLQATVVLLTLSGTAMATFPVELIDCNLFDPESPHFLGESFGFGTELIYTEPTSPLVTTGFEGFTATAEQVAAITDFAPNTDLPVGGQTLDDLFPGGVGLPGPLTRGEINQSISGVGDFVDGFTSVTLNQRKRLAVEQDSGSFVNVLAQGKGYAPFDVLSEGDGPIDVRLTIALSSLFDFEGEGFLSESLAGALLDISDPTQPVTMDGAGGFYFADEDGVFSSFSTGVDGEGDADDSFFTGPASTDPDSPHVASFLFSVETQLTPDQTYGLGIFGDGSVGADAGGFSWLDSGNTLSVSLEVLTPGARLVLPGGVVPEPTGAALLGLAAVFASPRPWRRRT